MHSQNPPPQLRNTKPGSSGQSLELLEEIVEEILSRLPVKSLLRFRCVSKSWRSLIGNDRFIKTQFENSTENTSLAHHRVIIYYRGLKQCSLQSLLNDELTELRPVNDPMGDLQETDRVVGCCNGVVCIFKPPRCFLLWNPSTRITVELPNVEDDKIYARGKKSGFGWDEWSGAYKVFAVVSSTRGKICKVYNSKKNAWNTVEQMDFRSISREGKFVSGKLHWCRTTRGHYGGRDVVDIVNFDLKTEVFGMMEQPCEPKGLFGHRVSLGVLEGCLSVLSACQKGLDVWVMKESWMKVIVVPLVIESFESLPFVAPLCIGLNGEILLMLGSSFLVYNPKVDKFILKDMDASSEGHVYVESLV